MIYLQFLIGFIVYTGIAYVSYSDWIKASNWYFPLGITGAILANLIWLWISKVEPNSSKLLIKGLYWDSMLTAIYILMPLVIFNASLNFKQSIGLVLVIAGLIMVKL